MQSPAGLKKLDRDDVFVRSWKCPDDQIKEWRLGSTVCAELLLPHNIESKFIFGAYVNGQRSLSDFQAVCTELTCTINTDIFL
jgi:hypothetical protein